MMTKNKTSCVYKIICINNKFYIGSSIDIDIRLQAHIKALRKNKHFNPYLQRAWNKYGEKNFRYEIIETVQDINQLLIREKWWIDTTECYKKEIGFNMSLNPLAPMRGRKHSEKTKQKLKITRKQQIITQEHKNNISLGNTGRIVSENTRQKIALGNKGKKCSKEQRENMSRGHIGITPSKETMLKLWEGNKKYYSIQENRDKVGKCRIGKKLSEETKNKISLSHKKRTHIVTENMTKQKIIKNMLPQLIKLAKENKSLYEISKDIKISSTTLAKWLKVLDLNLLKLFIINGKNKMGINGFKTNNYNNQRFKKNIPQDELEES